MNSFWTTLPKPILALAPMEGVNDSPFRQICKQWGADVVYTEFSAAEALIRGGEKGRQRLRFDPGEQPVVAQIFGRDIESFKQAAKIVEQSGCAGLDINLGCPARKVVARGAGSALLRDPQYARQLIEAALSSFTIPVSIKIRTSIKRAPSGPPDDKVTALDLLQAINDLPIQAIMVHGRSFEQGHVGQIDVDTIKTVKANFPGVVLANGGLLTPEQVQAMLDATGADGVGIARGAWGNPWIFKQAREYVTTSKYQSIGWADIKTTILKHARLVHAEKGDRGLIEFRKHLVKYIGHRPNASRFRAQATQVKTLEDVKQLISVIEKQRGEC